MRAGRGEPGGVAALAVACAATALAACLKDSPLVVPGSIYDAETAIRRAAYASLDSIEVLLVDESDTARVMRLWGGPPDAAARLPTHVAGKDERWFFRVEGYRRGKGLCYSEVIRESVSTVRMDACHPRPAPRFVDSLLDFHEGASRPGVRIRIPPGYAEIAELFCRPHWISVERNIIRDEDGSGLFLTVAFAAFYMLGPGTHSGALLLRDGNGEIDTLKVRAVSGGADLLPDTLRFGDSTEQKQLKFTNPFTIQSSWQIVEDAAWLTPKPIYSAEFGSRPGYPVVLMLDVDRRDPGLTAGNNTTMLRLVTTEPPIVLDSMVVTLQVDDSSLGRGILTRLAVTGGVLTPGFRSDVLAYTVEVPYGMAQLAMHAVCDSASTITLNGKSFLSGGVSDPVALAVGANMIVIAVRSPEGRIRNYALAVTRKPDPG